MKYGRSSDQLERAGQFELIDMGSAGSAIHDAGMCEQHRALHNLIDLKGERRKRRANKYDAHANEGELRLLHNW